MNRIQQTKPIVENGSKTTTTQVVFGVGTSLNTEPVTDEYGNPIEIEESMAAEEESGNEEE